MTTKSGLIIAGLILIIGGIIGFWIHGLFIPKQVNVPTVTHFASAPDSVHSSKPDSVRYIIKYIPSKPDTTKPVKIPSVQQGDTNKAKVTEYTSYKSFSDSNGVYDIIAYALCPVDSFALTVNHLIIEKDVPIPVPFYEKFTFGYITGILTVTILLILKVI